MLPLPLVLFDGDCGLCQRSVRWMLKHDRAGRLHFAPLRSQVGELALRQAGWTGGLPNSDDPSPSSESSDAEDLPDSMALVDESGVRWESDGVLGIAALLGAPWSAAKVLRWIPRGLRDPAYRLMAANRHRFFGKSVSCELPRPQDCDRLLDRWPPT